MCLKLTQIASGSEQERADWLSVICDWWAVISGKVRITSSEEAGKRVIVHEFETSPAIVSANDYPAILQMEWALGKKSSKTCLPEASDRNTAIP
jgi:hypothetical protein